MDKHTFENWDEQNYTLDLSLYDNVNVLAEGLDILEQELFKSLYHSKSFWSTHVAKRAKVMADLYHIDKHEVQVYDEFSRLSGASSLNICYMLNVFRETFSGVLKRLPYMEIDKDSGHNTDNAGEVSAENSDDDDNSEMEIIPDLHQHLHQSKRSTPVTTEPLGSTTSAQTPITAAGPTQTPNEDETNKAGPSDETMDDVVIPPPSDTKKKTKSKKKVVHRPMKVLTGHIPQNKDNVGEVLVYDIPATWSHDKLLAELKLWGHVISINTKPHRKYQSVRIKIEFNTFQLAKYTRGDWQVDLGKIPVRWFPISWSLKDRKEYERFQGVIEDLPPSFTTDLMWTDGHLHELLSTQSGLKAFKIVQYEGNRRKLIGYFDSWVNLKISLGTEVRWEV